MEDDREKLAAELFQLGKKNTTDDTRDFPNSSLKSKFQKLEKLKKTELSKWWDGITLKNYDEQKRVPTGLRILIFPTFDDLDDDLLKEWEESLHSSSFCMMHILIKNAERKLEKLKGQIADLEKEIRDMNLPDLMENNYAILKGVIGKHQLLIKYKKLSKIRRDERDYKQGRLFTFGKGFDEVQKPKVTGGVEVQGELSSVNYSS